MMFPEWPRRGNTEEGQRVHELHLQIAALAQMPQSIALDASYADTLGRQLEDDTFESAAMDPQVGRVEDPRLTWEQVFDEQPGNR